MKDPRDMNFPQPQFGAETSTADRLKAIGKSILDRLYPEPATTPLQTAARHALLVRLENAHRFQPQGRGARSTPVPVCGAVFVKVNPRFPKNLMLITRGMDRKTARGISATPERLAAISEAFRARQLANGATQVA